VAASLAAAVGLPLALLPLGRLAGGLDADAEAEAEAEAGRLGDDEAEDEGELFEDFEEGAEDEGSEAEVVVAAAAAAAAGSGSGSSSSGEDGPFVAAAEGAGPGAPGCGNGTAAGGGPRSNGGGGGGGGGADGVAAAETPKASGGGRRPSWGAGGPPAGAGAPAGPRGLLRRNSRSLKRPPLRPGWRRALRGARGAWGWAARGGFLLWDPSRGLRAVQSPAGLVACTARPPRPRSCPTPSATLPPSRPPALPPHRPPGLSAADLCLRRQCDASLDAVVSALLVVGLILGSAAVGVVMVVQVSGAPGGGEEPARGAG
jgi:hypothetical protein